MRRTFRQVAAGSAAAVVAALCVVMSAGPAHASTITVGCDPQLKIFELQSAIFNANDEANYPGPDTISLTPACHYTARDSFPLQNYYFALPPITSAITIDGNGASIEFDSLVGDSYGIFDVKAGGDLIVDGANMLNYDGANDGAYFHNDGNLLVDNVNVDGNDYSVGPAVINTAGASATFIDLSLRHVRGGGGTGSGGLFDNDGSMYIYDSVLGENNDVTATAGTGLVPGARVITNQGHLELHNTTLLASNTAGANEVHYAGGIANSGYMLAQGSEFQGFEYPSGAALTNSGTVDLRASGFYNNKAIESPGTGGAISNSGILSAVNTTFSRSYATVDGGVLYNTGSASIVSSTVYPTSTFNGADKITNVDGVGATAAERSILGECGGTVLDFGSNLKQRAASACPGAVGNANLQDWPRQYNGKGIVYSLGPGSAALNAVSGSCEAADERGEPRPAGGACDIGAFEDQPPAAPTSLGLATGSTNPGNSATLGLDWVDSADPDFDALTYRVFMKDSDDAAWTQVATRTVSNATLTSLPEGTYDFKVDASDGNFTSSAVELDNVVVDLSGPTSPTASPDRTADYVAGDGTAWWKDQVVVSWSGSTDPTLADGSNGSGVSSYTAPTTVTADGATGLNGTATDAAGNSSAPISATFHVDSLAPTIGFGSCPTTVTLGHAVSLGWTASDGGSGLSTPASGSVPVNTSTIGQRTLTATADDHVGHETTATCVTQVVYEFTGYFKPVGSGTNSATAGRPIAVAFGLAGNQGLGVFAAGYPVSAPIACGSTAALTTGTPTNPQKALSYGGGRYSYLWSTDRAWKGTCRQLVIKLNDGTFHRATFSFK